MTELYEKWIYSRSNYVYTRFEEFRTCTDEVLFTNEHKAVFTKNTTTSYIDIEDLNMFKDFSNDSKTVFKTKSVTAEIITLINARKDKNIDDSSLKKIKEHTCTINNLYDTLEKWMYRIDSDRDKIYDLCDIYYNLTDTQEKDNTLEKISKIQNNLFDSVWNIVYKKYERDTDKITTDKNKNIGKYLKELKKITDENNRVIFDVRSEIINLLHEIEGMLAPPP